MREEAHGGELCAGELVTSEEDEAEGEPHVARGGREHGREGCAQDAAEYVGSVRELVLPPQQIDGNVMRLRPAGDADKLYSREGLVSAANRSSVKTRARSEQDISIGICSSWCRHKPVVDK